MFERKSAAENDIKTCFVFMSLRWMLASSNNLCCPEISVTPKGVLSTRCGLTDSRPSRKCVYIQYILHTANYVMRFCLQSEN